MSSPALQVPRADLATRPCCVEGCPQRARWWVGPKVGGNGIDDYTEVCADHVEDVLGETDTVVEL